MKTLYNENFYNVKGVASNSAFVFLFFFFVIAFYYSQEGVTLAYLLFSGAIYAVLIYFLRKNWDVLQALFRTFFLKSEHFYSQDLIFDFLDNIHGKYYLENTATDAGGDAKKGKTKGGKGGGEEVKGKKKGLFSLISGAVKG